MPGRGQKIEASCIPTHSYATRYQVISDTGRSESAKVEDSADTIPAPQTIRTHTVQPEQTWHITEVLTQTAMSTLEKRADQNGKPAVISVTLPSTPQRMYSAKPTGMSYSCVRI